ncbi:MAG: 50S ribosomal protein L11 methyltransferase [Acidobacteriota bacterium]|jgi:ribosomal protein L11 methyltransferase|nr:50S ribosomal protein L11 methyltransferase [Acidobacteriota bacterium]
MSENYIEAVFRADVDSGEILAMLSGGEELGCWEDNGVIHIFWPESRWSPEALEDLRRALLIFGIDPIAAGLTVEAVPDRDWNATWAASLTPIRLGRRIRVRQSWHLPDENFDGIELVIDPRRAFGTGHHSTTQLVIEWLEKRLCGGERILDVGTGSGILSMAAIRLGAASALGIDNDPVAVECAREYARVNGFGGELELRVGDFDDCAEGEFDVIVANIDGKTLPALCPELPRLLKPGGRICLSGLQEHDLEEITAALNRAGFAVKTKTAREEWLALECG